MPGLAWALVSTDSLNCRIRALSRLRTNKKSVNRRPYNPITQACPNNKVVQTLLEWALLPLLRVLYAVYKPVHAVAKPYPYETVYSLLKYPKQGGKKHVHTWGGSMPQTPETREACNGVSYRRVGDRGLFSRTTRDPCRERMSILGGRWTLFWLLAVLHSCGCRMVLRGALEVQRAS